MGNGIPQDRNQEKQGEDKKGIIPFTHIIQAVPEGLIDGGKRFHKAGSTLFTNQISRC